MYQLRELNRNDIPEINKWRSDKNLISCLGAPFRYIDIDIDYKWYDNYIQNRNTTIRCAIVDLDNPDSIQGIVSLSDIDAIYRSAQFHIMIGYPANRGKGLGYFATKEILIHAFSNLNLNRVELDVLESNTQAQKLYEKIGFVREGIKRQAAFKNGMFVDKIMMSILREEFNDKYHQS